MNKKIIAAIILYNPEINRLGTCIDSVKSQVNHVYCIDNGSDNINSIRMIIKKAGENVSLIRSHRNRGIARALNEALRLGEAAGYEWLLTLDQDSIVNSHLISNYSMVTGLNNISMVTCIVRDRSFGIRKNDIFNEEIRDVERCITSGSLLNIHAARRAGGFDNRFFIDYVDFDLCYSLREAGYRIIQINYEGLLQEMGKTKQVFLPGAAILVTSHDSIVRYYYYARNIIWFIRKHKNKGVLDAKRYYLKAAGRFLSIFLFEERKLSRSRAMLCGFRDGLRKECL